MSQQEVENLKAQIARLKYSKLELIRTTSCELERLRTIIKIISGTDKVETLNKLIHDPTKYEIPDFHSSTTQEDPEQKEAQSQTDEELDEEAKDTFQEMEFKRPPPKSQQSQGDTLFRLSNKRMSYTGFEFSDFGFMTTDFDQLSRGHTSWVNHVIHHRAQNGICLSASDDWSIMFWRMKRASGREQLQQERFDRMVAKYPMRSPERAEVAARARENTPNVRTQHLTGEVFLHPVLKINTGLEVKAIEISQSGELLACTCFDDEEDEGNPELQLYFDSEQRWRFKPEELEDEDPHDRREDNDRVIKRKIVPLGFEPVARALCISNNGRKVFIAMYSTRDDVAEYRNENPEDEDYPTEACTLVCVDVVTRVVTKGRPVDELMQANEYVNCMDLSPDGVRLVLGTNNGRLLVVGAHLLMDEDFDEQEANPVLTKRWVAESDNQEDGAITSVRWSSDSEWIISGHASGAIKIWKKNKERRMTVQTNKTLSLWMKRAKVQRKQALFKCKWVIEGIHTEAVNSLALQGSTLISGSDDGNVFMHDLTETFADLSDRPGGTGFVDCSPTTVAAVEKIHQGRMVNSVALSGNYTDNTCLMPTLGLFMLSSGADNVLHCISLIDLVRESIRKKHFLTSEDDDES